MRVHKTFTLSFHSRVHRHQNEIALAFTFYSPFSFGLTIGEWSWDFGIGDNDSMEWYGPFLSYVMPTNRDPYDRSGGYFTAGWSSKHFWESA